MNKFHERQKLNPGSTPREVLGVTPMSQCHSSLRAYSQGLESSEVRVQGTWVWVFLHTSYDLASFCLQFFICKLRTEVRFLWLAGPSIMVYEECWNRIKLGQQGKAMGGGCWDQERLGSNLWPLQLQLRTLAGQSVSRSGDTEDDGLLASRFFPMGMKLHEPFSPTFPTPHYLETILGQKTEGEDSWDSEHFY